MTEKQFISTIKYVASAKPVFLLSEIAVYLDEPMTAEHMYSVLRPHLLALGLAAKKIGTDFEISRILPSPALCLDDDGNRRLNEYLGIRTFPRELDEAIGNYIIKKTSRDLTDPVILDRLRHAIVAQKDDYWKPTARRALQYTKGYSVLGYLAYHFPVYFMQTRYLLAHLLRDGLLKREMTILDLGTGPGVIPLAVADFWTCLDNAKATVYPVEQSKEHIEAFTHLVKSTGTKNSPVTIMPPFEGDITRPETIVQPEQADLIVFSNVLNELAGLSVAQRADMVMKYADRLTPDGTILIIEPAEEATSTSLRVLSIALKKRGLSLYAPCIFAWGTNCTPDRCWSFVTAPSIQPTRVMNTLAACGEPFRYVNTDIKYSYVILRKDGKIRLPCHVSKESHALRLSRIHLNVGKRVTVIAAKMSEDLGDTNTHMFRLCDGSAEKPVYGVVPAFHITEENQELISAPYGTLLEIRNALVRYNPAHDAYNLLVSRHTTVGHPAQQTEEPRSADRVL